MYSIWHKFKAVDGVTPTLTKISGSASRLSANMSLFTRNMSTGFNRFRQSVFSLRNAFRLFVVSLGVRAIWSAIDGIARLGDMLAKTSITMGISAQALRELSFVGERLGVTQETTIKGLQKLNRNMGELQVHTGTLFTALKKLAPEFIKTLKGAKTTEESFYLLINRIEKMPNTFQKTALAVAAFGRNGVDMLKMTKAGTSVIDELIGRFRKYAGVMSSSVIDLTQEYADAQENLKASFFGLRMAIAEKILPEINKLIETFAMYVSVNREMLALKIGSFLKEIGKGCLFVVTNFKWIGYWVKNIAKAAASFLTLKLAIQGAMFALTFMNLSMLQTVAAGGMVATQLGIATTAAQVFKASLLTNPLMWIPIAIGALVTGLTVAYLYSERFRDVIGGVLYYFKQIADFIFPKLIWLFDKIYKVARVIFAPIIQPLEIMFSMLEKVGKKARNDSERTRQNYLAAANSIKEAFNAQNTNSQFKIQQSDAPRTGREIYEKEKLRLAVEKMVLGIEISKSPDAALRDLEFAVTKQKGFRSAGAGYTNVKIMEDWQ